MTDVEPTYEMSNANQEMQDESSYGHEVSSVSEKSQPSRLPRPDETDVRATLADYAIKPV